MKAVASAAHRSPFCVPWHRPSRPPTPFAAPRASGLISLDSAQISVSLTLSTATSQLAQRRALLQTSLDTLNPVYSACGSQVASGSLAIAGGAALNVLTNCTYGTEAWAVSGSNASQTVSLCAVPMGAYRPFAIRWGRGGQNDHPHLRVARFSLGLLPPCAPGNPSPHLPPPSPPPRTPRAGGGNVCTGTPKMLVPTANPLAPGVEEVSFFLHFFYVVRKQPAFCWLTASGLRFAIDCQPPGTAGDPRSNTKPTQWAPPPNLYSSPNAVYAAGG